MVYSCVHASEVEISEGQLECTAERLFAHENLNVENIIVRSFSALLLQ